MEAICLLCFLAVKRNLKNFFRKTIQNDGTKFDEIAIFGVFDENYLDDDETED